MGIGVHKDIQEAIDKMVHYKDEFLPNEQNHKRYMMIYERIYKKMYKRVQPLYGELREINKLLEEDK